MKDKTILGRMLLQCPYCNSKDIKISSGRPTVSLERTWVGICKDCGHSFSETSFTSDKVLNKSVDERLSSLISYGLIEETKGDTFVFTALGRKVCDDYKTNKSSYWNHRDNILLDVPLWRILSKILPIHPSKEKFLSEADKLFSDESGVVTKYNKEVLWHRYSTEVIPALERRSGRYGIKGLGGVTILVNKNRLPMNPIVVPIYRPYEDFNLVVGSCIQK